MSTHFQKIGWRDLQKQNIKNMSKHGIKKKEPAKSHFVPGHLYYFDDGHHTVNHKEH